MQVYDILFQFANKAVVEGICSGIGEVYPSDFSVMEGGDFLRVRVILDISKPLSRGRKITLDDGSVGWVSFKYERLPNICYWCGCIMLGALHLASSPHVFVKSSFNELVFNVSYLFFIMYKSHHE